jgi:hypothetical protein
MGTLWFTYDVDAIDEGLKFNEKVKMLKIIRKLLRCIWKRARL